MSFKTDTKSFTEAMEAAVAEYGADYIYPANKKILCMGEMMCQYFDENEPTKPLCLIGVALNKLGVTNEDIPDRTYGAYRLLEDLGFEYKVYLAASAAQNAQDTGDTWGEALLKYKSALS